VSGWGDDERDDDPEALRAIANGRELEACARQAAATAVRDHTLSSLWSVPVLQEMNRLAVLDLEPLAGAWRDGPCTIRGSGHVPPDHREIPALVDDMLARGLELTRHDAVEAAAFVLWRICWIHPFAEGNGRVARAFSYAALSAGLLVGLPREVVEHLGATMPGTTTVPNRLKMNRLRYQRALEAADAAQTRGACDVSELTTLLERCLKGQLVDGEVLLDY
jgi:Fic family protein